jgi:hypothetical protein
MSSHLDTVVDGHERERLCLSLEENNQAAASFVVGSIEVTRGERTLNREH